MGGKEGVSETERGSWNGWNYLKGLLNLKFYFTLRVI